MSRLRDDPLEHGFAHAILGEQRVGDLSRPQRLTWRRGVCMGQGGLVCVTSRIWNRWRATASPGSDAIAKLSDEYPSGYNGTVMAGSDF